MMDPVFLHHDALSHLFDDDSIDEIGIYDIDDLDDSAEDPSDSFSASNRSIRLNSLVVAHERCGINQSMGNELRADDIQYDSDHKDQILKVSSSLQRNEVGRSVILPSGGEDKRLSGSLPPVTDVAMSPSRSRPPSTPCVTIMGTTADGIWKSNSDEGCVNQKESDNNNSIIIDDDDDSNSDHRIDNDRPTSPSKDQQSIVDAGNIRCAGAKGLSSYRILASSFVRPSSRHEDRNSRRSSFASSYSSDDSLCHSIYVNQNDMTETSYASLDLFDDDASESNECVSDFDSDLKSSMQKLVDTNAIKLMTFGDLHQQLSKVKPKDSPRRTTHNNNSLSNYLPGGYASSSALPSFRMSSSSVDNGKTNRPHDDLNISPRRAKFKRSNSVDHCGEAMWPLSDQERKQNLTDIIQIATELVDQHIILSRGKNIDGARTSPKGGNRGSRNTNVNTGKYHRNNDDTTSPNNKNSSSRIPDSISKKSKNSGHNNNNNNNDESSHASIADAVSSRDVNSVHKGSPTGRSHDRFKSTSVSPPKQPRRHYAPSDSCLPIDSNGYIVTTDALTEAKSWFAMNDSFTSLTSSASVTSLDIGCNLRSKIIMNRSLSTSHLGCQRMDYTPKPPSRCRSPIRAS